MYTRVSEPVRMLIGGLVGILSIGGWGALALGALEGIFGRQPNPTWIVLGFIVFMSGPVILSFANKARWPRALLTGLLSPVIALMLTGGLFAFSSILEWSIGALSFDIAPIMAAVYVAALIGVTELLTRQLTKAEIVRILRSVGLAFSIVFGLELFSNIVSAVIVGNTSEAGWVTWLVITLYAILIGVNTAYFDVPRFPQESSPSNLATIMCIGLNFLVLVIAIVAGLFV